MTSETAYEDVVVVPEDLAESQPIRENPEDVYDAWYEAHFFANAYVNAAEAIREEASRAFLRGNDEIAFLLRQRADDLEAQGNREAREWEENHQPK